MKVLQINSVCGIGSTGRIASDIHNSLIAKGHESYIAFGRDLPKNCDNAIRIGTKMDNYTHVAKTRILDKHGFGSKKATIEFIDKLKKLDPDIIHLHNIHGYYINVEILFEYLRETNKAVVWTLHDCWSFTGHCSHFDYIGCEKWKTSCFNCPQKKEYPKSFFIDNSEWNYNKKKEIFSSLDNMCIITPSNWLENLVKNSFLAKYDTVTIHNGIDLSIFKPIENGFRKKYNLENKFIILGVSSVWNQRKGFEEYIEISNKLNDNEVIVLVGVSEKQKQNLPKNIVGITKTDNTEELAGIYSSADIFLNLTLEDTYPTVNLEAIACRTPVITYNTGGAKETVHNLFGQVIDKQMSKDDIIEIIRKCDINPLNFENIGFLEKKEAFRDYFNLYSNIVAGGYKK